MQTFHTLDDLIEGLSLYHSSLIADFGAGAGYLSIPIAKRLTRGGKVFALDIQEAPLEALRKRARDIQLFNIETVRADLERDRGSKLGDGSADWVVIANILFQATEKKKILDEAYRILKNKGKILCIEWKAEVLGAIGPRIETRLTPEELKEYIEALHCTIEQEFMLGEHHFGLVAQKP